MFCNKLIILAVLMNIVEVTCKTCKLPDKCSLVERDANDQYNFNFKYNKFFFVCNRLDIKFAYNLNISLIFSDKKCLYLYHLLNIHFQTTNPTILDNSFDLEGLIYLRLNLTIFGNNAYAFHNHDTEIDLELTLKNIQGFEINSFKQRPHQIAEFIIWNIQMRLYDSGFEFYSRNKRIETCEEYLNLSKNMSNFFQQVACDLEIKRVNFKTPICPLALNNSYINYLKIFGLIDTFYKQNSMRFLNWPDYSYNITIKHLILNDIEKVTIDKAFLNPDVFKRIRNVNFNGELKSIDENLFSPQNFPSLKSMKFFFHSFCRLIHRQGIGWIKTINNDININLNNASNLSIYHIKNKIFFINLQNTNGLSETVNLLHRVDVNIYFPEEDFCLYLTFPFHHLVFIGIINSHYHFNSLTCTFVWLIQFIQILPPEENNLEFINIEILLINQMIERCNFTKMKSNCNNKTHIRKDDYSNYDTKDRMVVWQFISIVLSPIISLAGIVGNVLVVVVTCSKKNEKTLKEKQYIYMKLKSIANSLILFIQIVSLMNDCQSYNGIYCSSIQKLIGIQYFKIVFTEFFCNYLRFLSNSFHIGFAVNRLSLIGKEHSKFTTFISNTKVKYYTIVVCIAGLFVTFIKGFRFRANFHFEDLAYPFLYADFFTDGIFWLKIVVSILNCLCDLINGLGFFFACIVIDIQLVIAFKRTTSEKLAKLGSLLSKEYQKDKSAQKSLKDAVSRTILMIVLNSLVNSILKLPSSLVSMFEVVRLLKQYEHANQLIYIEDKFSPIFLSILKCEYLNTCQAIEDFFRLLFNLSVSFDILFYCSFDKKFKLSFLTLFR